MRLSVTLVTGAFFSAAFVICIALAYVAVGVIEGWTIKTIDEAHEAAGLDWVAQEASGLNITLSGTAPSEAARFQAMQLATTITVVKDSSIIWPLPQPPKSYLQYFRWY